MKKKIIIIILIIVFLIIALYSMRGFLTPYVSFKEAISSGNFVQVIGKLRKSTPIKYEEGFFSFEIEDSDGTGMNAVYRGTKPLNFEHSDQIVLLGKYNIIKKKFEAEKLLVKCPSKYKKGK